MPHVQKITNFAPRTKNYPWMHQATLVGGGYALEPVRGFCFWAIFT